MSERRPNILLITTDQQRHDALGINANRTLRTPNLDALASSGTNFSRCYITCPVCIPARRTLLSGLHPDTHGMRGYHEGVEFSPEHTLPGCLRAAGYQTQLVGKLHMHPQRKRFGYENMILSDSPNYRPTSTHQAHNDYITWLRDKGAVHVAGHGINGNGRVARPWTFGEELHHTSWVADSAARFFDTTRDPSTPWFLHASFVAPHPPLIPPQAYWDRYVSRDLRATIGDWAPDSAPRPGVAPDSAVGPFDSAEIHDAIAGYYGLINHIDDRVAFILDRCFEYGNPRSRDPLWIIFSSDHGEMLGDHHLFRKSLPYEGSAHVPLLITGRNIDHPTGACDALCGWEDLMPTILDLVGVPIPDGLDGRSLLPAMQGGAAARDVLHGVCLDRVPYRSVITGNWKYIWFINTNEEQLFNLADDPQERRDLSAASDLLDPFRKVLQPVAAKNGQAYDVSVLTPCRNKTPRALKFPGEKAPA